MLVPVQILQEHCAGVLRMAGMRAAHAAIVAESLVFADLRGVHSHGVVRLPTYLERVRAGVMAIDPEMEIQRENPASALVDARNGFGQIAGARAMDLAIQMAGSSGVGMVAVKNSNHFGTAAFFAMRALPARMVGMVVTNASPAMAPHNARGPLLGTNPLAVAIPAGSERPIVLDMSTSVVARGKIRLAARQGARIPLGWAVDAHGQPTDDPGEALKGSLLPMAGPKGAGLSLVIDVLCGIMTGTALTGEVKNVTDTSGPAKTGHMFLAINVGTLIDPDLFARNLDAVIQRIRTMPAADGTTVCLPGEPEFNCEAKHRAEGVPVAEAVVDDLDRLGDRYGVGKVSAGRAGPHGAGGNRNERSTLGLHGEGAAGGFDVGRDP